MDMAIPNLTHLPLIHLRLHHSCLVEVFTTVQIVLLS